MRLDFEKKIGLVLIFGLTIWVLILQFLFLAELVAPNIYSAYSMLIRYIAISYRTAMYMVVAILIWTEIKNLEEFHIDKFTVATFILGAFLQQRLEVVGGGYFLVLIGATGISIIVALIVKRPRILRTDFYWALLGVVVGGITIIAITYLELLLRHAWVPTPLLRNNIMLTISNLTIREFFASALVEEILFRGFLWGYLKRRGWEERKIFWIQGLLFWITHFSRLATPFTFFVAIPILTLISSKLTLRTKQVFPAVLSHAVINILSAMLNLATY